MALFSSSGLNATPTSSEQQNVSTPFQPYVNDLLSKTQALTGAPTPAYTGQLTAGPSDLQNQAWQGLSSLTLPSSLQNAGTNLNAISQAEANMNFTPVEFFNTYKAPAAYQGTNFTNQYQAAAPYQASNIQSTYQSPAAQYKPTEVTTGQFSQEAAQQYMNPYIQQALNPQLEALQRQQAINQQADMAKLAQAGAFGGSRQAILQGQNNYNLLQQQANLIGQGYNQAYNQALRNMQYGAGLGLQGQQAAAGMYGQGLGAANQLANIGNQALQAQQGILGAQAQTGAQQQALQQQILDKAAQNYATAQQYPYQQLGFMQNMLQGLPITTTSQQYYQQAPTTLQNLSSLGMGMYGLNQLFGGGSGGSSGSSGGSGSGY